ncbi:MAG TPA: copper transporter, partial [Rubrobacteraceae bacterium]|nr:copper transporter [Rubrobacteraceae bacterium]
MPDLRYHLISLISVFLALAIGILLGVAMADRGVVSNRVQAEITSIQQQLDRQQREIARRDEQIADRDALLEGMSEVMI